MSMPRRGETGRASAVLSYSPREAQAALRVFRAALSQGSPPPAPAWPCVLAPQKNVRPLHTQTVKTMNLNDKFACWEGDTVSPLSGLSRGHYCKTTRAISFFNIID